MSSNQQSLKTALFLALLALGQRGKRRVVGLARASQFAIALPWRALRGIGSVARNPMGAAREACGFGAGAFARNKIWCVAGMWIIGSAFLAGGWLIETAPEKPAFLFSAAHAALMEDLAPDGFLEPAADWTAQRCANGSVGRKGASWCKTAQPPQELGDARVLFAEAVRAYEGLSLSAENPVFRAAAKDIAKDMANRRRGQIFGNTVLIFESTFLAIVFGWGMLLAFVAAVRFKTFQDWLVARSAANGKAPNDIDNFLWMGMVFLLPMVMGALAWGELATTAALWGGQQTPWVADRALLWGHVQPSSYRMANASGSEMALGPMKANHSNGHPHDVIWHWDSSPNDLGLRPAGETDATPSDISVGRWTPSQMASSGAESRLAQQAPSLTPEQRRAAWVALSSARAAQTDLANVAGRGTALFVSLGIAGAICWGIFLLTRKTVRAVAAASSKTLKNLAEEGAQIPLAKRERQELEKEMRKAQSEAPGGGADRARRQAKRL